MRIASLEVRNYRGFGEQWVNLVDNRQMNIIIGRNNTGKTNLLNFVASIIKIDPVKLALPAGTFTEEDLCEYDAGRQIEFKLTVRLGEEHHTRRSLVDDTDVWTVHYKVGNDLTSLDLIEDGITKNDEQSVREIARKVTHTSGGAFQDRLRELRNWLSRNESLTPISSLVIDTNSRLNLNDKVRKHIYDLLHSKPAKKRQSRQKIEFILAPLRELMGRDIKLDYPNQDELPHFIFDNNEDVPIPFNKLASGIQCLFIMLEQIGEINDSVVCIDEPENHLHPAMQRVLLRHLAANSSNNQFYLATHSPVFLDFEVDKAVFRLSSNEDRIIIDRSFTSSDLYEVVNDLGFRPSDIVQANGVIWVEGPSDRIYIKRWLELVKPILTEGHHYTFQFYGGSLLGRLSTEYQDQEVDSTKLSVLTLNPNFFFVMDSDQDKEYKMDDLVPRQRSIINALKKKGKESTYWVTAGRTIENYLPDDVLKINQFEDPTRKNNALKNDKVKFADSNVKEITPSNMDKYGLGEQIDKLISIIEVWND